MKIFCVFLFVATSSTFASLTAPQIKVEEINSEWKVIWEPVKSSDENDPVLGYKVKVNVYVVRDKNHYLDKPEELYVQQEIQVNGTTTELKVNLTQDVPYEFFVLAYAKSGDGPASEPVKVTDSLEDV